MTKLHKGGNYTLLKGLRKNDMQFANQAPQDHKANYQDHNGGGNMQHDATPALFAGPMRRNCDMCVRRKVRCCGTKPRCSICVRKGDVCVYSLKRRPGPRVRLSNSFGSHESSNNNCMVGADKYNTRRMLADGFPTHPIPLISCSSAPVSSNTNLMNGTDMHNALSMSVEEDPTASPTHPRDAKRPCNTSLIKDARKVHNNPYHTYPNNTTANKETPANKLHCEESTIFRLPSPMKIPDSMIDLMDDCEHLLPVEFVKLENLATGSLDSCTSIESGSEDHIGDESTDFLDIFDHSKLADDKSSSS